MIFEHKRYTTRVVPDPERPIIIDIIGENFIDVLKAKDIGEGGLSVYVPYQFEGCKIDREIELIITMPNLKSFKVNGMIRHKAQTHRFFFGISFTKINSKDHEAIKTYVKLRADEGHIV